MAQLEQFIIHHWELWLALLAILILIFINELRDKKKRAKELSPQAAIHWINHEDALVIDLRDVAAFRKGHIINSTHTSMEDFNEQRMDKYKTKPFILVCAKGLQSAALASKLRTQGFLQPMVLAGGIAAWQAAELPLVKGK